MVVEGGGRVVWYWGGSFFGGEWSEWGIRLGQGGMEPMEASSVASNPQLRPGKHYMGFLDAPPK